MTFELACADCERLHMALLGDALAERIVPFTAECSRCLADMQRMRPIAFYESIDTRWQGSLGMHAAMQLILGRWPDKRASYRVSADFVLERDGRLRAINPSEPDGEPPANWWFEYLGVHIDERGLPVPVGFLGFAA